MPPNQLPILAIVTLAMGSYPANNIATKTASEANGMIVAAKNDDTNSPKYPNSNSHIEPQRKGKTKAVYYDPLKHIRLNALPLPH